MAPDRHDETADDAVVTVVDEPAAPSERRRDGAGRADGDATVAPATDGEATPDGEGEGEAGTSSKRKKHSPLRTTVEWAIVLGAAVTVALVLRTFVLSAFYIPSGSMEPTLNVGDRVLVNKLSYKLHDVNRGDVVVFERPPGERDSSIKDLIKRVVGLPGETVEGHDGVVYICEQACTTPSEEGQPLTEGYVNPNCPNNTDDFAPRTLGSDEVWVMGDNRCGSSDSRAFGPIDEDSIVGRAFVIVWPLGDMGWL